MPTSITHIIPRSVFNNTYHGSYKDTISRVRFFEASPLPYRQVLMEQDVPESIFNKLTNNSDPAFLIEYCSFPKTIKALRSRFPNALIAVRSHNIEPLQHFDNHGWWPKKGPVWMLYGMLRLFIADLTVKRYATVIYSISDWEKRVYWDWLPGHAKVEWLPYFCPDHLLPDECATEIKRNQIVCMPTSQKNRKSWDLVTRFIEFAEQMKAVTGDQYEYLVTGDVASWGLPENHSVKYLGMIDDLRVLMPRVKAVALLSCKGYGYKTTMSDAIAQGALVLAHPRLAARCPDQFVTAIVTVDPKVSGSIGNVIKKFNESVFLDDLDNKLKATSIDLLSRSFTVRDYEAPL